MSWNGLALAHYVGCITWLALICSPSAFPNTIDRGFTWLALMCSPSALPNIMGRGFTIP